ncbi:Alpha/Beta hydrolase protein [Mycena olivaceomarginata]|nr:Alpha/Beta hydrolase protein [Mycena olivaceomarginata]
MPLIDLETSTGPGSFRYTLSTPAGANAEAIVQGTPTLVLIHPIALGSEMFHPIYADPRLRRFNLLMLDLRGHVSTSATVDPHTYGRETAAKDVLHLMVYTAYSSFKVFVHPGHSKIPASHLMGVSMGSCIALQMAIFAPERVLSICIFSPLPLIEPPEVMAGRQEIWADNCVQSFGKSIDGDPGGAFINGYSYYLTRNSEKFLTLLSSRSGGFCAKIQKE